MQTCTVSVSGQPACGDQYIDGHLERQRSQQTSDAGGPEPHQGAGRTLDLRCLHPCTEHAQTCSPARYLSWSRIATPEKE